MLARLQCGKQAIYISLFCSCWVSTTDHDLFFELLALDYWPMDYYLLCTVIYVHRWAHDRSYMPLTCHFLFLQSNSTFSLPVLMLSSTLTCQLFRPTFAELCCVPNSATGVGGAIIGVLGLYQPSIEGLPGVLGNKGTWPFTFREQGISKNNF